MSIEELLKQHPVPKLDIGCGQNKQQGFIGMDMMPYKGVDIVHNVELFPWPIPNEAFHVAVVSHLVEHINPTPPDPRIDRILQLLKSKELINDIDIQNFVGEVNTGPIFIRFMDEVWRILKPGGQFALAYPYAGSPGFYQDPSHINNINEMTWWYFDPKEPHVGSMLYKFYKPKPWKIIRALGAKGGNMEVVLEKREEKPEYTTGTPGEAYDEKMKTTTLVIDQQR